MKHICKFVEVSTDTLIINVNVQVGIIQFQIIGHLAYK